MKLPAYAKPLLAERRLGRHPPSVLVIYGQDWSARPGSTRVAVKPREALGLKWHCVAGLLVELTDRALEGEDEPDADGNREFLYLAGEIAREAGQVNLLAPYALTPACPLYGPGRASASDYAALFRDEHAWPAWWSEETENIHGQNRRRWLQEIENSILAA